MSQKEESGIRGGQTLMNHMNFFLDEYYDCVYGHEILMSLEFVELMLMACFLMLLCGNV